MGRLSQPPFGFYRGWRQADMDVNRHVHFFSHRPRIDHPVRRESLRTLGQVASPTPLAPASLARLSSATESSIAGGRHLEDSAQSLWLVIAKIGDKIVVTLHPR